MDSLYLRQATEADMKLLFDWANDSEVRANSFNTKTISWEEHCNWLKDRLLSPEAMLYILLVDNVPAGQVRLEKYSNVWRISYSIAKTYRGHGYGKAMLAMMENWLIEHGLNLELRAEVKADNNSSRHIFMGLGYHESLFAGGFVYTKKEGHR